MLLFSARKIAFVLFCSGIIVLYVLQLFTFDSFSRLQTVTFSTLANVINPYVKTPSLTFGFASKIYVLSLPARTDRRRDMEHLRKTLGLDWTYIEAINAENPIVNRILNSVRLIRSTRSFNSVFTWPSVEVGIDEPIDAWDSDFLAPMSTHEQKPSYYRPLVCATDNDTITSYDPSLPEHRLLTGARIACWYSHLSVIHNIANDLSLRLNDAVLVLEDDVDMEVDIEQRLQSVWASLPVEWDIVYLGHCWSNERNNSIMDNHQNSTAFNVTSETHIYRSTRPLCTHAYALSRSGARRLLLHLRHPEFAYSRSIDKAISWLIESNRLESFSIVPSVVVQRKVGSSDIMPGQGSTWRAGLIKGVFGAA